MTPPERASETPAAAPIKRKRGGQLRPLTVTRVVTEDDAWGRMRGPAAWNQTLKTLLEIDAFLDAKAQSDAKARTAGGEANPDTGKANPDAKTQTQEAA